MDSWRRNPLVFWIFGIPPSVWLIVFFLAPLALVWAFSFGEKRGIVDIAITGTLENYWRALDPLYLQIFAKSFWFAGITTGICLLVATGLESLQLLFLDRWSTTSDVVLNAVGSAVGAGVGLRLRAARADH